MNRGRTGTGEQRLWGRPKFKGNGVLKSECRPDILQMKLRGLHEITRDRCALRQPYQARVSGSGIDVVDDDVLRSGERRADALGAT
ncbi:hypothetical protein [Rhizohabitans arisaemae]|uniref:hypothetical protein n=1 Tax=Rhizohabitans arisaemae TaxID=2720610 RepID=UPI0024B0517C|nr:hypothetical protein [Rhizohabitans arisaemae]